MSIVKAKYLNSLNFKTKSVPTQIKTRLLRDQINDKYKSHSKYEFLIEHANSRQIEIGMKNSMNHLGIEWLSPPTGVEQMLFKYVWYKTTTEK